jgi:hypothetical protein
LGRLDKAVADEYDMVLHMFGVHGKNGKPAEVRSRGNVVATPGHVTFNMSGKSVEAHDGTIAGRYGKSPRNIEATFERIGDEAHIEYSVNVGGGIQFRQGIYKIALSLAAYYLGSDMVTGAYFDPIRNFVVQGIGDRGV